MGKTSLVSYVFDKPSIAGEYVTITIDILHTTTFREFIMTFGTAVFDAFFSVKRPFYQSAKALRLDAINRDIYRAFATDHFKQAGKELAADAFDLLYDTFWGVTFYVHRILKDAYADTQEGAVCDTICIKELINSYIEENDAHLREQLSLSLKHRRNCSMPSMLKDMCKVLHRRPSTKSTDCVLPVQRRLQH